MKLIILNGSSCSGKSTIIKNILEEKEHYFHLSYDSLKWQFSQYASGKYYEDIRVVMLSILDAVCKLKYKVICEVLQKEFRKELIALAKGYGYEVVEINLEADWKVLSERFDKRVAEALANPKKRISNISKDRFKELFEMHQNEKNPLALVFRTDTQSIEEVSDGIMKLLS